IARQLGVGLRKAFLLCRDELAEQDRVAGEDVAHRRRVQLAQIERAKAGIAQKIAAGDVKAADTLARLVDIEAKLIGSHAPLKHMAAIAVRGELDVTTRFDRRDTFGDARALASVVAQLPPEMRDIYPSLRQREVRLLSKLRPDWRDASDVARVT